MGTEFRCEHDLDLSDLANVTPRCGNNVCDLGETASGCAVDCAPLTCSEANYLKAATSATSSVEKTGQLRTSSKSSDEAE